MDDRFLTCKLPTVLPLKFLFTKIRATNLFTNWFSHCVVQAHGFHRYKQGFLFYKLFIDDYKFVATRLLLTHPDLVKVPNCAVDMNS